MSDSWQQYCTSLSKKILQNLWATRPTNGDAMLVCETKEFHVHKVVLTACSPFFADEFQKSSAEKINLENTTPAAVEMLLQFIYAQPVAVQSIAVNDMIDLLASAHRFQLDELFQWCCQHILGKTTESDLETIRKLHKDYDNEHTAKLLSQFIENKLFTLLQFDHHLSFDYERFQELVKAAMSSLFVSSEMLAEKIVKWVRNNESDRAGYMTKLFSLLDVQDVSATFVKTLIENEVVKTNAVVLSQFINQAFLSEDVRTFEREEKKLIKSLRVLTFRRKGEQVFCSQLGFDEAVDVAQDCVVDLPFKKLTEHLASARRDLVYLVGRRCGEIIVNSYSPRLNVVKSLESLKSSVGPSRIAVTDDCLYILPIDSNRLHFLIENGQSCYWDSVSLPINLDSRAHYVTCGAFLIIFPWSSLERGYSSECKKAYSINKKQVNEIKLSVEFRSRSYSDTIKMFSCGNVIWDSGSSIGLKFDPDTQTLSSQQIDFRSSVTDSSTVHQLRGYKRAAYMVVGKEQQVFKTDYGRTQFENLADKKTFTVYKLCRIDTSERLAKLVELSTVAHQSTEGALSAVVIYDSSG